jgi:hypothetical protein
MSLVFYLYVGTEFAASIRCRDRMDSAPETHGSHSEAKKRGHQMLGAMKMQVRKLPWLRDICLEPVGTMSRGFIELRQICTMHFLKPEFVVVLLHMLGNICNRECPPYKVLQGQGVHVSSAHTC